MGRTIARQSQRSNLLLYFVTLEITMLLMGKSTINGHFQLLCYMVFWFINIAMEHGSFIDGLPINSMVDLSMAMLVITRWYGIL